ncbi:MAG: transposase [candidate division WOR-3 bacterium]
MKLSIPELDHGDNMARRRWTKEEKIQIVLTGLKDGVSVADLCRRHGISQAL